MGKIKVRERLTNLKNDIIAKPLKYAIPILSLIIIGSPLESYAKDTCPGLDKDTCPNPEGPKSKLDQYRELGISIIGLKKCLDPCATPLQKALYCSRPCCILAGLTAGYIADNSPVGSKIHIAATACCISSWNAYGISLMLNRKATRIQKK